MKFHYDKETDSLYIHLNDQPSADSEIYNDNTVLDFDADNNLVGIDIQHASKTIDMNTLELENMPYQKVVAG